MKEEQAAAAFEDVFYKTTFDEVSLSTTHIFYLTGRQRFDISSLFGERIIQPFSIKLNTVSTFYVP